MERQHSGLCMGAHASVDWMTYRDQLSDMWYQTKVELLGTDTEEHYRIRHEEDL